MALFVLGGGFVVVLALLLSHFAARAEWDMDYDGARPKQLTKEQQDAHQRAVGFVVSSIAGRS